MRPLTSQNRRTLPLRMLTVGMGLLLALWACANPNRTADCLWEAVAAEPADQDRPPLRLVACPVDAVVAEERAETLVFLINDGPSALYADAALEPGFNLYFDITGPDGQPLEVAHGAYAFEPMEVPRQVLVRKGVVGRRLNLTCELPGDVMLDDQHDPDCTPDFQFEQVGEYLVTVSASITWCPERCPVEDSETVLLEAESFSLVRR